MTRPYPPFGTNDKLYMIFDIVVSSFLLGLSKFVFITKSHEFLARCGGDKTSRQCTWATSALNTIYIVNLNPKIITSISWYFTYP